MCGREQVNSEGVGKGASDYRRSGKGRGNGFRGK